MNKLLQWAEVVTRGLVPTYLSDWPAESLSAAHYAKDIYGLSDRFPPTKPRRGQSTKSVFSNYLQEALGYFPHLHASRPHRAIKSECSS